MQEKADDPAFVAQCQSRVKALVCEAALLPVRVDRDLERIQVKFCTTIPPLPSFTLHAEGAAVHFMQAITS